MDCILRFPDSNVAKALRKITGSNDTLYASYLSRVIENDELTQDFVDWYKERHPKAKEVSTDDNDIISRNIAKGIVEYYNYFVPDGRTTVRKQGDNKSAFYDSVASRTLGKRIAGGIILRGYNKFFNVKHDKNKLTSRADYERYCTQMLRDSVINWISIKTGIDKNSIKKEYNRLNKTEGFTAAYLYIHNLTENMELSLQEENQLAMLREMVTDSKNYFNEVFRDSRLSSLVFNKKKDDTSDEEKAAMNAEQTQNSEDDDLGAEYFDESIRVYDSHDGLYKTFEFHVNNNIRSYFNGLRKLRSTNTTNGYDKDDNNSIGLADTMNASQCIAVMYSSGNFANVDSMIESVKRIAETQPGMESFIQFYDALKDNRDFACEVYRTFAKIVIGKTEVTIEKGEIKVNRTNNAADKLNALKMEFINTSRYNAISLDAYHEHKKFEAIRKKINDFKADKALQNSELDKKVAIYELCKELAEGLKRYYPTIDTSSIVRYVDNKKDDNGFIIESQNLETLNNLFKKIIDASRETLKNYRARQYETSKAKYSNEQAVTRAIEENRNVREDELIDIPSIWANEYISSAHEAAALSLASELVDYSIVKIELNARNVEGNLSSNVINSSFITNFIDILGSELNSNENGPLAKFGKWKLDGKQYNLSNILIEQRNKNNAIVSYGLFRKSTSGNTYVPTSYARDLIDITLFQGASDRSSGKNVLYSKMSSGDYIATALSSLFNDTRKAKSGNIKFASYFMRTPSDAHNNYLVSAPRYFSENLIKADGSFNRNHIIFDQYRNIIRQELSNAVRALNYMFKVTNGAVELNKDKNSPDYGKPLFNDNISSRDNYKFGLYKNYHYNGEVLEKVGSGLTAYWRLTGNVFHSNKLTYVDENGVSHNFIEELINDNPLADGTNINFLYGAAKGQSLVLDAEGNVVISNELQEAIDEKIEQFINALVTDGSKRIHQYDALLKKNPNDENIMYSEIDIRDFMINYHLMYNGFDDLFEGDAKFYGTSQDFLKRAKEVQGGGVPYANEESGDFGDIYNPTRNIIDKEHSALEGDDFAEIRAKLHDMHLYDKFRAVTIKNTVKRDPMTAKDGILSKQLQKAGLSRDEANKMMDGYDNTKVNDAQSYITFEEWVRRIALRGQLYKYKPLIEAILDESKPLTVSQINEFIQVQKNFYYDQYKDVNTGIIVPRQIKNAEFVLVPRFIKDTELKQVYNAMIAANIDQLNTEETSKAGKARVLTLWNEDGVLDEKAINNFIGDAKQIGVQELFNYKYLYTQQETPQHVNAENKAGIQIMKKILDNIDEHSPKELRDLKDKFIKNFCENIQDSYEELCEELGIELDEEGNIQINEIDGTIKGLKYNKLADKFVKELNRLNATSRMYDFVEMDDVGITKMPPYLNAIYYKLQNISQSLFNNGITRQKLPGFHAAQITQIGFRPFSKTVKKSKYSSKLQYHPNGKPYIEIMLPKANFGLSHLSNEEALKQLQDEKLDEIIGYRIPTEGKQSVCVMKVVGFTDDALGSTIVVPDGWVAQTGSDFDIDSVYGIQWESYIDSKGNIHKVTSDISDRDAYNNYILSKLMDVDGDAVDTIRKNTDREFGDISAEEAHNEFEKDIDYYASKNDLLTFEQFQKSKLRRRKRAVRNNEILDSMIGILKHPNSLEENLSRSNSDDLETAINTVLPNTYKNRRLGRSQYNILDQADYQNDAMSGAALKGFSVTRDTLCSVSNAVHPVLEDNNAIFINYANGRKVKHFQFGWSANNKNIDGKLITVYSSQTTAFILDAIKKGAIPNVNDLTFATFKTFADLGSNYNLAVAFIGQPAISRIIEAYHRSNSIYSQDNKKPVDEAIISIARDLGYTEERLTARKALKLINSDKSFVEKVNKYLNRKNQDITGKTEDIERTYIDEAKLLDRINERGEFTRPVEDSDRKFTDEQLAFDLATILTYNKISSLAGKITNMAMVLNPDKFGAKQTIYATRKVFDDISNIILNDKCPLKVEKDGKKISMLEAIYPGVVVGDGNGYSQASLDYFLQHKGQSAYPSLYTFLKYATAPSIKINQTLFKTQDDYFVDRIKEIQSVFSGRSTTVSEKLYNDVERYYLSFVYNMIDTIKYRTHAILDENGKVIDLRNCADYSEEEERARLFGFNRSANLSVEDTDESGEKYYKPFTVKDINKPTQEEVNDFAKLSPAQKVAWVQQNFRDSVVCEYFKVDLSNRSQTYNTQTVRYVENNVDIETVYQDFLDTFNNENPFLALTAMDLVKYSFVVEGFRMSKQAVNQTIPNDILYNDLGIDGTGIVTQLRQLMANPSLIFNDDVLSSDDDLNDILTRYVRSHMNMKEISHTFIGKQDRKHFKGLGQFMYLITDIDTIINKGLGYLEWNELTGRDVPTFNKFVTIQGNKTTNLYRIVPVGEGCILYPLNKLETNESSEWSGNIDNNKFPSETFYKSYINEQILLGFDINRFKFNVNDAVNSNPDYKFKRPDKIKGSDMTPEFNINDARTFTNYTKYTNSVKEAVELIKEHFALGTTDTYYFNNQGLRDIIKSDGTIQVIDGQAYHIYKTKYKPESSKYASEYIAVEPINKPDNKIFGSSINEKTLSSVASETKQAIINESKNIGTEESVTFSKQLKNSSALSDVEKGKIDEGTLISSITQYLTEKYKTLLDGEHGVNMFYKDPKTGKYLAMDDIRLGELLRTNPEYRRRFIKNLLDARAIVNQYRVYSEFKTTSDDPDIEQNLRKIEEIVHDLQNNRVLKDAEKLYVNEYLKSISKNPLIKEDIISIFDGYHTTSGLEAAIHDLQESGSPLVQIVLKDVMSDVRAREMEARRDADIFKEKLSKLRSKAKSKGHRFDLDKIIDKDGKIIRDYNEALKGQLDNLKKDVENAVTTYGIGSIEHLKAKLAFDKFILNNFNQELPDSYYANKIALEEEMINKFPAIYSKYKKLTYQLYDVLSHINNGELDPAFEAKRVAINREIQNLRNNVIVDSDGNFTLKGEITKSNPTQDELANTLSSANALKNFISKKVANDELYYEYTDKFGFEELLDYNLDIVRNAEADANGNSKLLESNPTYKKAKEWIHKNARYVYDFTPASLKQLGQAELENIINGKTTPENAALRAQAAVRWLFMDGSGINPKPNLSRNLAKIHDAYDYAGVIDARKFTDEEIDSIKKEQENRAKAKNQGVLDENAIISCVPEDDTIYNGEFWKKITSHGMTNKDYLDLVKDINDILRNSYDKRIGVLRTSLMSDEDIQKVIQLFEKLGYKDGEFNYKDKDRIKKKKGISAERGKEVAKFISEYCESNPNVSAFRAEEKAAMDNGAAYYRQWCKLNYEWVKGEDNIYKQVPNRILWGGIKLREDVPADIKKKYIDITRTNAMRAIKEFYQTKKTPYYYDALKEASKKSDKEFNEWWEKNHTYNTYTHSYEPLECWLQRVPNENFPGHYEASFNAKTRNPREVNKYYRPNLGYLANYKTKKQRTEELENANKNLSDEDKVLGVKHKFYHPDGKYDNNVQLTDEEKDAKTLFEDTIAALVHNKRSINYFAKGYMPTRAKAEKHDAIFWIKDFGKHLGLVEGASGKEEYNELLGDYEHDFIPDMPMANMLKTKAGEKEIADKYKLKKPIREEYGDDVEKYKKDLKDYEDEQEEIRKIREREHRESLDRDWESVMSDFIVQANRYNAIQDNKFALYFGEQLIKKIGTYQTKYSSTGELQTVSKNDDSNQSDLNFVTKPDDKLLEQYRNWVRRLVFDMFRKQQGTKTNLMSRLQALTSTNYMTLNVRGGIANITFGETTIIGENFAKQFFGRNEWLRGKAIWSKGISSYIIDAYKETSSTLSDAICKAFDVIDFDEIRGLPRKLDVAEASERIRNAAFSTLTAGEHFMQNGALFSMLCSHKLVPNPDIKNINHDSKGRSHVAMTETEYMYDADRKALLEIMNDEQKKLWDKYLEKIKSNPNITRKYAWWREDVVGSFLNAFIASQEDRKRFDAARKKYRENAKKEFESFETMYDQLELRNGKMAFKKGSILDSMDYVREGNNTTDAYGLLGEFRSKVISVNKYIHGVYDKMGAAKIEREWWGAILMQYHKHIPMGIARFYRRQGYFNEERGNVNKGIFTSIKDFLTLDIRAARTKALINDEEYMAVKSLQEIAKATISMFRHWKTKWDILPTYERANIRRGLSYLGAIVSAVLATIALKLWFGVDDDDDEGIIYNLSLYEADRLASEAWQFTPIGAISETKKLFSQPIAAESIISDILNGIGQIAEYITSGDDDDMIFQSGRFAGEHKAKVYFERRIPIYRNIKSITDVSKENHYYKRGGNMITFLNIDSWIDDLR